MSCTTTGSRLFATPLFPSPSGNNLPAFLRRIHLPLQRNPLRMWLPREMMRSLHRSLSHSLSMDVTNIPPLRKLPHRTPPLPREPCPRTKTSDSPRKMISRPSGGPQEIGNRRDDSVRAWKPAHTGVSSQSTWLLSPKYCSICSKNSTSTEYTLLPSLLLPTRTPYISMRPCASPTLNSLSKLWRRKSGLMRIMIIGKSLTWILFPLTHQSFLQCGPCVASGVSTHAKFTNGKPDSPFTEGNKLMVLTIGKHSHLLFAGLLFASHLFWPSSTSGPPGNLTSCSPILRPQSSATSTCRSLVGTNYSTSANAKPSSSRRTSMGRNRQAESGISISRGP